MSDSQANPKLLSLLEKLVHPIQKAHVKLQVGGVFAFFQDWLTTDELNANMFTYQLKLGGLEILQGQSCKRQKTEEQIKKEEEEKAAQGQKAPPPPPQKDDKNQVPEPVISPEQEEAIKRKKQQEEEERLRKEAEWNALDEETKFYRTYEDQYQKPAIRWEKKESNIEKEGQELVVFEERIFDDKGDWLYFIRKPTIAEDEIAKLKKGKPKNLNVAELTSIVFRAWVNYDEFTMPGCQKIVQRCRFEQFITPEMPPDLPKIPVDTLQTYTLITITLTPPVQPLVKQIQPKVSDLVPQPPPIPKLPPAKECINEFRQELVLTMESLAMEYSTMFSKELNAGQDQKIKNVLTVQKKQEMQKHQEQFLYDFNVSGKYKVLKERMKKSIVKICRDKFQKHGSVTGITTDQKDQFYSEIYVFLMEQMRTTLGELINSKRNELHEDIVTSYEQSEKERDQVLNVITKETKVDQLIRLSSQYQAVNQMELAEQNLRNLVASNNTDSQGYYTYARFLLRQQLFSKAEELLVKALSYDPENREFMLLQSAILMRRNRAKESLIFLLHLTELDPLNQLYNFILSFLYYNFLQDNQLGEQYQKITERIFMRNNGLINAKALHQNNPNPSELPAFKPLSPAEIEANQGPQLSNDQLDLINMEMIQFFSNYNLLDMAQKAFETIFDQNTLQANLVNCQILYFEGKTNDCVIEINQILENFPDKDQSKTYDILIMKANICFLTDKLFECEETYLKALKLKGGKNSVIFLRLGYVYLKRKAWGDAKATFARAVELQMNSSLSWLGLGIASLRLGDFQQGEEALAQANIYDHFNGETWGYLALLCLMDRGRFSQANQSLREMLQTDMADLGLLQELGDQLVRQGQFETAEKVYMKIFDIEADRQFDMPNYGDLNQKLGDVYSNLKRYSEAAICYEEAFNNLIGEIEQNSAQICMDQAQYHANNPDFD